LADRHFGTPEAAKEITNQALRIRPVEEYAPGWTRNAYELPGHKLYYEVVQVIYNQPGGRWYFLALFGPDFSLTWSQESLEKKMAEA